MIVSLFLQVSASRSSATSWRQIPISRSAHNILSEKSSATASLQVPIHTTFHVPKSYSNDNLLDSRGGSAGASSTWRRSLNLANNPSPSQQRSSSSKYTTCSVTLQRADFLNPGGSKVQVHHYAESDSPSGFRPRTRTSGGSRSREDSPVITLEKYDESPGANIRRGFDQAAVKAKADGDAKTPPRSANSRPELSKEDECFTPPPNFMKPVVTFETCSKIKSGPKEETDLPKFLRSEEGRGFKYFDFENLIV